MEVAGITLGLLSLLQPLLSTVTDAVASERSYGSDAENLRVRCSAQQTRLESLERVLFDAAKFPFVPGRIWDHIPARVQMNIIDMLRRLYALLNEYVAVKKKYDLEPPQLQQTTELLLSGSDAERRHQLVAGRDQTAAAYQRAASGTRRLRWAVWDKKTAQRMVEEFEEWNNQVKQMVETVWWPFPFFSTSEQLAWLGQDRDAATAGLMGGLPLRRLLVDDARPSGQLIKELDIPRDHFRSGQSFANLITGSITGQPGTVIVEYKKYETSKDGSLDTVITRRIRQLALLLHTQSDPRFKVLRCNAFFNDRAQTRFGFAFHLPPDLDPRPVTLAARLCERSARPSLGSRVALAHALAESLQLLHSVGWVHKSLRSENVVLFPPKDDNGGGDIVGRYKPTLFGFEYSRPDSGFSSRRSDTDNKRNLYRHPDRWWLPQERFAKCHDIYALGVVLLEIGLWERVDMLERGALLAVDMQPEGVRARLLLHVEERLGFYTGSRYQCAVRKCLDGELENAEGGDAQVQMRFAREVTDILRDMLGSV